MGQEEIQEDGCVLVRLDRLVAWRSDKMVLGYENKLMIVMKSILSI